MIGLQLHFHDAQIAGGPMLLGRAGHVLQTNLGHYDVAQFDRDDHLRHAYHRLAPAAW